jgi:hypothetical protein
MYQNTAASQWGYVKRKTSEYSHGAGMLFAEDVYGPEVMKGLMPQPGFVEECNLLFDRTALLMKDVFQSAHKRHIKTCVGMTLPMVLSKELQTHLKAMGRDWDHFDTRVELYEGTFRRIQQSYPIDYYWLWTDEGWMTSEVTHDMRESVVRDWKAAIAARERVNTSFKLATAGWVLGPETDRAFLDSLLPKDIAMSCINGNMGADPVEPAFEKITGRSK